MRFLFYFQNFLLPNLAKSSYERSSLDQHHKVEIRITDETWFGNHVDIDMIWELTHITLISAHSPGEADEIEKK
jgi:hypothetical protein